LLMCLRLIAAVLLCLSLLPTLALAASTVLYQVKLKNGDLVSGELKSSLATELVIHTPYAGDVKIKRSEVLALSPLGQQNEQPSTESATTTALQLATNAAPANVWSLQLDFSAASRAGKEQAQSYSLGERFEYRLGDWRSKFDAHYDYETKEAARKTHQYGLNPGLDYFYSPQLFWRLHTEYNYNYLASDYKNIDLSTGPGYAFFQQGPTRLDLILLAGRKQAYFREDDSFRLLPDFHSPLGYNTMSLQWDFSHKWPGTRLEVFSEGAWLELLSQPLAIFDFERELNTESGLRYALTDKIRLSWSWQYDRTELTLLLPKAPRASLDLFDSRHKFSIGATF